NQLMTMMTRIVPILMMCGAVTASAAPAAAQPEVRAAMKMATAPRIAGFGAGFDADDRADDLYDEGREAIEEGRYDRAIDRFNRVIDMKGARTDAALYWKAYSQHMRGQRADALTTLSDLQRGFGDSRWIKDAKALEVEVRQASGQPVTPASVDDDELKLLALRSIMQNDPDQAIPIIE